MWFNPLVSIPAFEDELHHSTWITVVGTVLNNLREISNPSVTLPLQVSQRYTVLIVGISLFASGTRYRDQGFAVGKDANFTFLIKVNRYITYPRNLSSILGDISDSCHRCLDPIYL